MERPLRVVRARARPASFRAAKPQPLSRGAAPHRPRHVRGPAAVTAVTADEPASAAGAACTARGAVRRDLRAVRWRQLRWAIQVLRAVDVPLPVRFLLSMRAAVNLTPG